MLSEEKIQLMTQIAVFEQKEAEHTLLVNRYFKNDYISYHMIKSALYVTISFILILGIWAIYHAEEILNSIDPDQIAKWGFNLLLIFGVTLVLYLILSYFIYSSRYDLARKRLKDYQINLKQLEQRYEINAKPKVRAKGVASYDESSRF